MLESEIKRKSKERLKQWGWLVVHIIQSNTNGIPDTMILRKGKMFFIEFKRPGEAPDPLQQYRIRKLREQGFETLVVTNLNQIEHLR
jgi:Holliday junction resolvase